MKRTILLSVVLVLFSTVGFAQWSFDLRAGANASTFSTGETRMAIGLKAGVGAEYAFSDLFAVRPGLFFSMRGASDGTHRFETNGDRISRLSYLEVPVWASFRFDVARNFRLALNAGPYAAYRISGKPDGLTDVKDFDAGLAGGLDFLIGHHWVIGGEAQYGLTKVARWDTKKQNSITYSLMLGYRF